MTDEETIEFDRLKTARDSLLLTVANLRGQLETIKEALAQEQEQEPVKDWVASHNAICALLRQAHDALALTSYPMKRAWVGLTDEEIMQIWGGIIKYETSEVRIKYFARAIESKMKEINT